MLLASVKNNEDSYKIKKMKIRITALFSNALARYCTPSDEIPLDIRSNVVSVCHK
jgi:membrane protease subunit (stomatin/prohibitin family)